jgi:hypothetical protein
MAEAAKKTAASDREQTGAQPKGVKAEPLENMPERPKTIPHKKTERLFIAYTIVNSKDIGDLRVYGVKAEALEFAIDQEPAWKWVEVAKGESVAEAIKAKVAGR